VPPPLHLFPLAAFGSSIFHRIFPGRSYVQLHSMGLLGTSSSLKLWLI